MPNYLQINAFPVYYFSASIGGIISLFFGFSFISLAELIFYALLRPLQILFTTIKWRIAKSAKLHKRKSIQLLFKKRSVHSFGNVEQKPFITQNTLRKGNAWQVVLRKQQVGTKKAESWQPGMEYIE